jgi:hypothetical protein
MLYALMLIIFLPSLLFAAEPYGLKGDTLGMDLKSFKKKYHRTVQGHNESLPWCSDYSPKQEIKTTLSKAWHHEAGIVNCRINFPCEEREENHKLKVAGVATDVLIYHFIDKKLYMITAKFIHGGFDDVKNALLVRYGKPSTSELMHYQKSSGTKFPVENLLWDNKVSSIRINEMPEKPYFFNLTYQHRELIGIYDKRKPSSETDNLSVHLK